MGGVWALRNAGSVPPSPHAIIARDDPRRPPCRSAGAAAGLPRQPRAGEPHRAGVGAGHQPAARHRLAAAAAAARRSAGGGERGADHPRPGAAGVVLSAAARALRAVRARLRPRLLGARLPALGAGAGALFDAAGAAQYGDRAQRRRSAPARRRARHRHDAGAIAAGDRAAAGPAGDHGRHPHRRGLGDRHRHAGDADRPAEPRQLHLHRLADAELGVRRVRLRRRRRAGAGGRSIAGADAGGRRAGAAAYVSRLARSASSRSPSARCCPA